MRVMLMDLSCMRTGIKIYVSSVMGKMVANTYFRSYSLCYCHVCFILAITTVIINYLYYKDLVEFFMFLFAAVYTESRS